MDPIDSSSPVTTVGLRRRRRLNALLGGLAALALVATVLPLAGPADADPPAPTATAVYGQPDFTSNRCNNGGRSATSLCSGADVTVDSAGTVYIVDDSNSRVLAYPPGSTTATRVYGQPNFTSGTDNNGGVSATSLRFPSGVAVDNAGTVYIADQGNHRVLAYPPGSTTATRVYGQPNFTSNAVNNGGISATSLWNPFSVAIDNAGTVYIADETNSRVLAYPAGSTTATRVYGQPDFTSGTANNGGISATSLWTPNTVAVDTAGTVYIADRSNSRVLAYPAGSTTATRVYGQPNFSSNTINNGGVSATSLSLSWGVAVDGTGTVFIADSNNHRVLAYPAGSTTANAVYGQPDFTSNTPNNGGLSATSLNTPFGVAIGSDGTMYVADSLNLRILAYPSSGGPTTTCEPPPLGMIGWWRGEDLTGEIGGNLTGSAPIGPGHAGQALDLTANIVSAPDLATVSTEVSVEGWIKPVNTGQTQALISRWTWVGGDEDDSYALFLGVNSELFWTTDETSTRSAVSLSAPAPQLYDGQFHHVAATWNQAEMTIYIDGQQVATQRSQGGILNPGTNTQFRLGSSGGIGSPLFYSGVLDEATVYDRALTAGEIAAIHTADTTGKCTTTTPPPPTPGTLWAWGFNAYGQLGDGTTVQRPTPTQIGASADWTVIDALNQHGCGVRNDGTLWCWGQNGAGEVGDGTLVQRTTPVQVGAATNWATVSTGSASSCAIRLDSSLWCWGLNDRGQLGNGTTTNSATPIQVGTSTNWVRVTNGLYQTCATRTDGTLWCWGDNAWGQLGNGTTTNSANPIQVGTATNWATLSGGQYITCGTRTDGSLWCWGRNSSGDIGDGTTTQRLTPTPVGTGATWATVDTLNGHTCALRTGGTLWCWGLNGVGQLGDGTTTQRLTPSQVGTDAWTAAGVGQRHTCATRTDGTLWCWGQNNRGQLGNGNTTNLPTPTQIGTDTNWIGVDAGLEHTHATRS